MGGQEDPSLSLSGHQRDDDYPYTLHLATRASGQPIVSGEHSEDQSRRELNRLRAQVAALEAEQARYLQELAALEKRVMERTQELEAANQHLRALTQLKDQFVANVSHQLRTPITSLMLYHDLLAANPEEANAYLETLRRETSRLVHTIESLQALSGIDQRDADYDLSDVDLNVLVKTYVTDRPLLAKAKGLVVELNLEPNLPTVRADEALLDEIVSILMTNALNYTPGEGTIVVSTHTTTMSGESWTGFRVSDTGPGIPADEHAHLFRRFYRGKVGIESGKMGSGLGLSLAKEIVDGLSGLIEVESKRPPDSGAIFTVWLPQETRRR